MHVCMFVQMYVSARGARVHLCACGGLSLISGVFHDPCPLDVQEQGFSLNPEMNNASASLASQLPG